MELKEEDLARLLRRSRRGFVDAGTAALTAEIETYAVVPAELLYGDVADTIRRNIELFVTTVTTGELPSNEDLNEIRVSAARRAEEGLPLGVILHAYHLVTRQIVQRLVDTTGEASISLDAALVARIVDFLGHVTAAAATGYLEEFQLIETGSQTAADRMLESLLTGAPRPSLEGYPLADEYAVLAVAIDRGADELDVGVDTGMASRRKLRRFRSALQEACDGLQPMASLTPEGGLALVPVGAQQDWSVLIERLSTAARAPVTAALTRTTPDELPAAALLARQVLDVVLLLERPSGLYALTDVSFEYQVTRPGAARVSLAALLEAVGDDTLLATLRVFLDAGGNRHRAARLVSAHPNTVDNRMRKVARLTGLDPTDPVDATRLRMGLLARLAENRARLRTSSQQ